MLALHWSTSLSFSQFWNITTYSLCMHETINFCVCGCVNELRYLFMTQYLLLLPVMSFSFPMVVWYAFSTYFPIDITCSKQFWDEHFALKAKFCPVYKNLPRAFKYLDNVLHLIYLQVFPQSSNLAMCQDSLVFMIMALDAQHLEQLTSSISSTPAAKSLLQLNLAKWINWPSLSYRKTVPESLLAVVCTWDLSIKDQSAWATVCAFILDSWLKSMPQ